MVQYAMCHNLSVTWRVQPEWVEYIQYSFRFNLVSSLVFSTHRGTVCSVSVASVLRFTCNFLIKFQTMHRSGAAEPPWAVTTVQLYLQFTQLLHSLTQGCDLEEISKQSCVHIWEAVWLRPPSGWWDLVARCHPWFYSGKTWNFPGYLKNILYVCKNLRKKLIMWWLS